MDNNQVHFRPRQIECPHGKSSSEALEVEALKKVNYDVDDRSIWSKEEINKVINSMTKENVQNLILEFSPYPVGEKFVEVDRQNCV